jgi:peptidoglycan/xylan/chitin deacetylase (PgdA/CDA1 family)
VTDVLVLCYHAVSPTWPAPLSVTPDRLERQLTALVKRGYVGATFDRAVHDPPAERTLAVTFDDAFESVLTLGAPILERLGLPATVFVPTAHPGTGEPMVWPGIDEWLEGPHREELMPLTWGRLRELAERGWEIGSHTRTHPHLTTLGDDELRAELTASKGECEVNLGLPCRTIAYPYGDQDARVRAAAHAAGYEAAAALGRSLVEGDRMAWPRVGIYYADDDRRYALKTSRAIRKVRASPAFEGALARLGR